MHQPASPMRRQLTSLSLSQSSSRSRALVRFTSFLAPLAACGRACRRSADPAMLARTRAAEPKRELEQYVTSAHLASRMIFTAATQFDDIDEKDVLDLGCGCAVLSIASVMMGAECAPLPLFLLRHSVVGSLLPRADSLEGQRSSVTSVDVDPEALGIAKDNVASVEMDEHIEFVHAEIGPLGSTPANELGVPLLDPASLGKKFDTVVMKCVRACERPLRRWRRG